MQKENDSSRGSLLRIELDVWAKLLFTALIMAALLFIVYSLNVPNPNMILIAGLVICSAIFGYWGGALAALIMFLYTLYFFSTDNDFFTFTEQNMRKVYVSIFGILVDMVFVCELKRREILALREIRSLTEKLKHDNLLLQQSSLVDSLTGVSNRLALRQDYPSFRDQELVVIMLDVDDFKSINDRYGHNQGDEVLQMTGSLLSDCFGRECCYRYGGDEFLVILRETSDDELREMLDKLMANKPFFYVDGGELRPSYSVGYVRGVVRENEDLRTMLQIADERMYASKRGGKGQIVGGGMEP